MLICVCIPCFICDVVEITVADHTAVLQSSHEVNKENSLCYVQSNLYTELAVQEQKFGI
jgi:hypothetical protein